MNHELSIEKGSINPLIYPGPKKLGALKQFVVRHWFRLDQKSKFAQANYFHDHNIIYLRRNSARCR